MYELAQLFRSTVTGILTVMRPRSYSRGRNTSASVTVSVTVIPLYAGRAVFVRFSLGGSEFRLATSDYSGHGGAKLVLWNSLLN